MILTKSEESKNQIISGTITLIIFLLLLLFLIFYNMITPNPPFPESEGGGGQELAFGTMNMGNGDIEYGSLGNVNDVISKPKAEENLLTDENGESINLKTEKEEKINENSTVITPVLPSEIIPEKTEAQKLAEKFKKNTGKNSGGIGNNETAGENGSPNGNPFKNGTGGEGSGNDNGNGNGNGPGSGIGKGGFGRGIGVDLKGRAVVKPPKLPSDTKEEGKVVVEITVDSEGNVIEANPNGRGTTTSSALLKAKAKHAALATKFNVDGKFEEQQGTITIVFSFD
jgi:hypothetical protein